MFEQMNEQQFEALKKYMLQHAGHGIVTKCFYEERAVFVNQRRNKGFILTINHNTMWCTIYYKDKMVSETKHALPNGEEFIQSVKLAKEKYRKSVEVLKAML
jgi:hypothetical protein